ncbi:MAG: DUF362 domain-containing protein [Ruminococcaceae bacterium]|nr:DUF362 domain-containing protein [Oscillospiraceae bacterium]
MSGNYKVYSSKCESYEYENVKNVIFEHLDMIISDCYDEFDFTDKNVVLKPNLLAKRSPDAGITTNPVFVRSCAEYFIGKGAKVIICDSPGGVYNTSSINGIYSVCGMKDAADMTGASVNFDMGHTEMFNSEGVMSKSFSIINPLAKADFIVNLCRLKTHSLCNMSAAVKNMYGSIPGLMKAEQHARFPDQKDFSRYLIDLCKTVKPCVSIIDAIIAMEGNGPAGGTLKKVGLVMSSSNPYVLDRVACHIMGFRKEEVLTVKNCIDMGLCPEDITEIKIVGENIESYVSNFKRPDSSAGGVIKQLPNLFGGRLRKWLEPRPVIIKKKCIGCGECARCCPQETIDIVNKKAVINYDKCIKCYCCQELCPMKAVSIKQNLVMKL